MLLKLNHNIGVLTIGLLFLSSCSSTKHVPEGEYLLRKTSVERDRIGVFDFLRSEENKRRRRVFAESDLSRNNFTSLQRQEPNNRFLRIPLRLWMHSSVAEDKKGWWANFMRNAGEPPVIFDSTYAEQSVRQMQQFLINTGHFNSSVFYTSQKLRRKQRIAVVFDVAPGQGYRYRNVSLDIRDDSLVNSLNNWNSRTLIKPGDPYNVGTLEAERLRVTRRLQNLGYFSFDRTNIEFSIDSSLNSYLMDITMIVNPPENGGNSRQYTFSDIYIFPDERAGRSSEKPFDTTTFSIPKTRTDTTLLNYHFVHTQPLQIKPHVIASKLAITPGAPFSLTGIDRTYENLLDLRVFRSTNISVQPQPIDTNNPQFLLNATIEVRQAPVNMWAAELELTSTSGLGGIIANTSFQNRNLFGGAEIFSVRLRGLIEMQYLFDKDARNRTGGHLIDNFDIGISTNLDIPRFVAPFYIRQTSVYRPRTSISVGYNYRFRFDFYDRQLTNLSFGYSWRQSRVSHTLFPLDINIVNIALTDSFAKTINTLSQTNKRLEHQYKDHFIFAARYGFSFSGQQGNRPISFNAFRASIESSGNSLFALSNLLNAPKHGNPGDFQQYHFLQLGYAQYIRADADFRRYWYLTETQVLVTRLMGGAGFVYGNSMALPYEKGFFAGGNNNVRAWPMNQLGPGSFSNPPNSPNIERIGDIVLVGNIEYRFPIRNAFRGALFVDVGNIWVRDAKSYPNGEFSWKKIPNDLAVGGGIGLRWDLNFFVIRLDAAIPLRDPAKPNDEKWVIDNLKLRHFVLNFGIGYPF